MLGDFGKLKVWALEPSAGGGPVQARRLDPSVSLEGRFTSLALREDGGLLAIGDQDGNVTLLETAALSVRTVIRPPSLDVGGISTAITFSPDGRTLAVGSPQGQILFWSVARPSSPQLKFRLAGQHVPVTSLVFDLKGQRLASCSAWSEPLVDLWNINMLEQELSRLGLSE
jgi:WD40 repeat protein